jgi:SH3 domain protein
MRFPTAAFLALLAVTASAETRFVTDQLEVTLRSGTSTGHSIVRMLRSGTPVDALEADPASGYTRVRLRDGTEGWVLSRYLMNEAAARDRLAAAEARAREMETRVQALTAQVSALSGEREALSSEREGLDEELDETRAELERIRQLSASALDLDQTNRDLRIRLTNAERAADELRQELALARDSGRRNWFLVGAGVLGAGLILGLVIPRLRIRRRTRWGDL